MSGSLLGTTAPTTIAFNDIPSDILVPGDYIEIDTNQTQIGLLPFPARGLAIGQGNGAHTAVPDQIYQIYSGAQATVLFGSGSPLADMCNAWCSANPGIPLDAVMVQAAEGSVAAVGNILFGGSATVVGSQAIGLAGYRVTFTIEPTDTPADMATNFIAAAAALRNTPSLPLVLTTNGTAGEVLCTSRVAGAVGNEYDIRANPALGDVTVPGVTITVTQPTGGEGVPGIEGVLSAITTTWYTDIFTCFTDAGQTLADLQPVLIERNNPVNPVDSVAWIAWEGTQGQLATLVGEGVNSQFIVAMGVTNPPQPTWIWSASMAAVAAFALMNDPARQLQSLTLPGVIAPAPADQMQFEEQQALLAAGIATFDVAPDNSVTIQRAVTTYTENPLGVPDTSWQDVMSVKVMSRIRYDWAAYRKLIYPRNKLSDDNSVASQYDQTIATPKRLANSWAARCLVYEKAGWIEDAASLAQQAVFIRDANNRNQIDASIPINVLGNLMVMAQQLVFTAVD